VTGLAWMDHEFGSSELPEDTTGWDWFSAQLSNGWDLMLYQLRYRNPRASGGETATPFSSGSVVFTDGRKRIFSNREFIIRSTGKWKSPRTGIVYPSGWTLEIPVLKISLTEEPLLKDQELVTTQTTGVDYWEGAVSIRGTAGSRPVDGGGYTELTGYGGPLTQLR
jgi:predicted secreted hydrolase